MSKISDRHCEVCLRKGIQKKARTLCDECREFYCKECSDNHLLYKASLSHSLIDLDPPGEESRPVYEDELASDFLELAKVSETTVLYRAQVAVESGSDKQEGDESGIEMKEEDVDVSTLKPRKVVEFSVKRPDDKNDVTVIGVLTLSGNVLIVDVENQKLKLFDSDGNFLSSTELTKTTEGVTRVNKDTFATCGAGNKVFLWTLRRGTIVKEDKTYDVDHYAYNITYNNTYYCVLHKEKSAITILDNEGKRVRKIKLRQYFFLKRESGTGIYMDSETHNIYVSCWDKDGILCMSVEGKNLWFTPISGTSMSGITEIHGVLSIADFSGCCIHMISKTGQYNGKLIEKEELNGKPYKIHYNAQEKRLYVCHFIISRKKDVVSVFSV